MFIARKSENIQEDIKMKTVTEIRMPSLADKLYLDENIEKVIPSYSCELLWAEYC